jgi:hypothetical protein
MQQRRGTALKGVDPDRGRRARQNNIITARNSAREEQLSNRRRVTYNAAMQPSLVAGDSTQDVALSLVDLQANVRPSEVCIRYMI